jgi:hypothetical protein
LAQAIQAPMRSHAGGGCAAGWQGMPAKWRDELKQNLMGSENCEPTLQTVPAKAPSRHFFLRPQLPPELGPFLCPPESCLAEVEAERGRRPYCLGARRSGRFTSDSILRKTGAIPTMSFDGDRMVVCATERQFVPAKQDGCPAPSVGVPRDEFAPFWSQRRALCLGMVGCASPPSRAAELAATVMLRFPSTELSAGTAAMRALQELYRGRRK